MPTTFKSPAGPIFLSLCFLVSVIVLAIPNLVPPDNLENDPRVDVVSSKTVNLIGAFLCTIPSVAVACWSSYSWPLAGPGWLPAFINMLSSIVYTLFFFVSSVIPAGPVLAGFCTLNDLMWPYFMTEVLLFGQRCAMLSPLDQKKQRLWLALQASCSVILAIGSLFSLLLSPRSFVSKDSGTCTKEQFIAVRVLMVLAFIPAVLSLVLGWFEFYKYLMPKLDKTKKGSFLSKIDRNLYIFFLMLISMSATMISATGVLFVFIIFPADGDVYNWWRYTSLFDLVLSLVLSVLVFRKVISRTSNKNRPASNDKPSRKPSVKVEKT